MGYYSEILPNIASIADEMTLIRSVNTEAINHDPAITYINTGTQQLGHPSMGAWLNYGLGSPSDNLPGYIVMISKGRGVVRHFILGYGVADFCHPSIRV